MKRADLIERILREHRQLEALMLSHQEALIEQDIASARSRYASFLQMLRQHIALENEHALPPHKSVDGPKWRTLVYEAEHDKALQVAELMQERLEREFPPAGPARLHWLIKMMDDERSLKNLLEHHHEREEAGLLPELAAAEKPNG